jgi:ABC-2 type transport system permease protein
MCFLSITANIIISSKMSDVRASQQVGSLVVLPILLLFIGQFTGIMSLGASPLVIVAIILIAMDIVIFMLAKKAFKRENILVNWK